MIRVLLVLSLACVVPAREVRVKRQNPSTPNDEVIDNIFNIPITAIRQTANAAQTLAPENSGAIDTVFQIPISTLQAVGNLVKSTSEQRRQNAEEIQQMRQERRERLLAQRQRQREQRELLQSQRLQQKQSKRTARHYFKDPLGLNALTSLLVGHHGLFGGHVSHRPGGMHGSHGGHGGNHGSHGGYEVHEHIDEDESFMWHGITAGFGSYSGSRPGSVKIQNKVAPREDQSDRLKASHRMRYQEDEEPPLQNKVAPRTDRISFH